MNKRLSLWCAVLGVVVVVPLAGCGDEGMSKKEIDSIKNSPPMTEKDWNKVGSAMKAGGEKRLSSQAEWAKTHPEEAAKINAERAKMGRAPLGGG
ncbi:MAG: hypothetical protein JSS65_13780 [Armatimonadetes bacterium]|nr:hypothetical protein [Armatimonadota bacterium]